ncbi:MAG: hypothetical protein E7066_03035 [Lentimicrobiaceae bacterium]|nr:hypothetical protein [Lentimicrobiaceae bacterium]
MKNIKTFFSLFFVALFASIGLFSCNKFKGNQEIPAYIHIDTFLLTTNYPYEGAASHKITDVWLYIDDNLNGCYELPAIIPVLERGKHKVTLYPGIKLNGISATRTVNPFYKPYIIEDHIFQEKIVDTVLPSVTYFSKDESSIEFWIEDFERQVSLDETATSDTTITRTERDAPENWDDEFNNSHYSGYVWIGDTLNYFCIASPEFYNLPNQGDNVFLEIDYKSTDVFEVGMFAKISGIETIQLIYVNPSPVWNKIYVNLGPNITDAQEAQYFKFYIAGSVDESSEAHYYFDNIKLVYRE